MKKIRLDLDYVPYYFFTKQLNYYYYCIIHEVAHEHRLTPADSHSRPQ